MSGCFLRLVLFLYPRKGSPVPWLLGLALTRSLSNIILKKKDIYKRIFLSEKVLIFDAILIFVDYFVVIHRLHRVFLVQNGTTRPNAFQPTYRPLKDNLEVINQYTFTQ